MVNKSWFSSYFHFVANNFVLTCLAFVLHNSSRLLEEHISYYYYYYHHHHHHHHVLEGLGVFPVP